MKDFHGVLKDAGITITKADIEVLEAKPLLATGGTGARSADEEKQLRLAEKNLTTMAHLTMLFGTEAFLNKITPVSTVD